MSKPTLASQVEKIVNQKQNLFVIFAIDGSGSIASTDFENNLKTGVRSLAGLLNGATIGVMQFAASPKTECPPTKDLTAVDKSLREMKQLGSSTATKDAVIKCGDYFRASTAQAKVLIVITDGCANAGQDPINELTVLKNMGVTVYALGIGQNVPLNIIEKMSSNKLGFMIQDYAKFMEFSETLKNIKNAEAFENPLVDVGFVPDEQTYKFRQPIKLTLHVDNRQADAVIPAGTFIKLHPNAYFQEEQVRINQAIPPHEVLEVSATLKVQHNARAVDFPGRVKYECKVGSVNQIGWVDIPTGLLRGDFTKHLYDIPVNMLMIGKKGGGKSALINCLITSLSKDIEPINPALSRPDVHHVTTEYTRYDVNRFIDFQNNQDNGTELIDPVPLYMYDTWGCSPADYKEVGYKPFIQGRIPLGTDRAVLNKKQAGSYSDVNPDLLIHVVVAVVPLGDAITDPDSIEQINNALKEAAQVGHQPIVVVTQIDRFEDTAERERNKTEITNQLSVNSADIFFHSNYLGFVQDSKRNITIDVRSRSILTEIWKRASTFKLNNEEIVKRWKPSPKKSNSKPRDSTRRGASNPNTPIKKPNAAITSKPSPKVTPKSNAGTTPKHTTKITQKTNITPTRSTATKGRNTTTKQDNQKDEKNLALASNNDGDSDDAVDVSPDEDNDAVDVSPDEDPVDSEDLLEKVHLTVVYRGNRGDQIKNFTLQYDTCALDVKNRMKVAESFVLRTEDEMVLENGDSLRTAGNQPNLKLILTKN